MLFQRAIDIEAGWSVVDPVLQAWREAGGRDLYTYPAGSDGPEAAASLLSPTGQQWRPIT
jgi:glucose-6-phosphate 1-dehydrogenase